MLAVTKAASYEKVRHMAQSLKEVVENRLPEETVWIAILQEMVNSSSEEIIAIYAPPVELEEPIEIEDPIQSV